VKNRDSLTWAMTICLSFSGFAFEGKSQVYNYLAKLEPPPLEIAKIGGGLYIAKGEWGSNVGFYVGNNEVLVIDSKTTVNATKKVIKEIGRITKNPITRVIYTHSDPDSSGGRNAYPARAGVICSFKVLDDWEKNPGLCLEMNAPLEIYSPWPTSDFVPAMTFDGRLNFRIDQKEVELYSYGSAHTDGDTIILFPAEKIAFIGDLVFVGHEPLIQDIKGGSSWGLVRALSILLSMKPEIHTFIPSHADPVGRKEIQQALKSIEETRDKVQDMVDAGKTLDDVKRAFGVQASPHEAGAWVWPSFAVTVYRELTENKIK
jgi:cyclase